jgi:alkanesulfonate monooxygenase SsuD/methylene tetrahydromethanopterin reductase-like flavin-dependent oxidoreductase (luciferase family)
VWNFWSTPDVLAEKLRVLHRHCDALGRDPSEIAVSTQALLFLSTDAAWVAGKRDVAPGRSIVGAPAEVAEIVGRYQEAGAGELIIPDSNLGPMARKQETCDLFMEKVAAAFR